MCSTRGYAVARERTAITSKLWQDRLAQAKAAGVSEAAATRNAYWFLMAFTVVFALVFGACALRRGMRRYAVKVANSDNAEANKA